MIQTKKLIPEIYSQSYDMSIFTGILDLVYTARELDLLRIKNCHLPQHCFQEDLPSLGSLFNLSNVTNRGLLSTYRLLVKNKGTQPTLLAAVQFATGKTESIQSTKTHPIHFVHSDIDYTRITIYLDFNALDSQLLDKLLYKLAPVGSFITVRPIAEYIEP